MKMALTRIGKEKIRQLTPITEGGEGYIYEFGNDILKIYKPCVDIAAKEKKVAMLIDKPLPKEAIKPITAVYDNNNKFIGYIMPKAVGEEVRVLTSKKYLKANGITTKDILEILVKIQDTVRDIHCAGYRRCNQRCPADRRSLEENWNSNFQCNKLSDSICKDIRYRIGLGFTRNRNRQFAWQCNSRN